MFPDITDYVGNLKVIVLRNGCHRAIKFFSIHRARQPVKEYFDGIFYITL